MITLNQRSSPPFAALTDSEGYKKIKRKILRIIRVYIVFFKVYDFLSF
jgi:hypothetical protein